MSTAEGAALFDAWMHEQGYTYHGDAPITGLTAFEFDKLQLGFAVKEERLNELSGDPLAAEKERRYSGRKGRALQQFLDSRGLSEQRKRAHKGSIRRRLKKQAAKESTKKYYREQFNAGGGS